MPPICLNLPSGTEVKQVPETAKPLESTDDLQVLARSVRGGVHVTDDGRYIVSIRNGRWMNHNEFGNRAQAQEALTYYFQEANAQKKLASKLAEAVRKQKLTEPEAPITYAKVDPSLKLDGLMHGEESALVGDPEEYIIGKLTPSLANVLPVRTVVRRFGPEGQILVQMMDRMRELHARLYGKAIGTLEKALDGLDEEEIAEGMFAHTKGGTQLSEAGRKAYAALTNVADTFYESARSAGVKVAERLENYFPYVYNVSRLSDPEYEMNMVRKLIEKGAAPDEAGARAILENRMFGTSRERAIRNIMEGHRAAGRTNVTYTEAQNILDRFMRENNTYVSGHLERERLAGLEPIHDARAAYAMSFYRNARRVAEAQVLGPNYEKVYQLIDSIRDRVGGAEADVAKQLLDAELGRIKARIPAPFDVLYDMQAMKLSFSVLGNLSQSYNTLTRVGFKSLFQGIMTGLREDIMPAIRNGITLNGTQRSLLKEHIRDIGAVTHNLLDEFNERGLEALLTPEDLARMNSPIRKGARYVAEALTAPFNYTEAFNRVVAARSGEAYFERIVADLADPSKVAQASRRLTELRMNPETVIQLAQNNNQELLTELKYLAGQRISNETQFVPSASSRGLWSQSPLGRFVFQFKQFTVGQSEFMSRELLGKYTDPERRLRAWALASTLAPGLAVGQASARSFLFGGGISGDFLDQARNSPDWLNRVGGVAGIFATVGGLGIIADLAMTAYSGNQFALQQAFAPPTVSTIQNALSFGGSAARAVFQQGGTDELEQGVRILTREFGGVGTFVTRQTLGDPDRRQGRQGLRTRSR